MCDCSPTARQMIINRIGFPDDDAYRWYLHDDWGIFVLVVHYCTEPKFEEEEKV